jgi:hypothetical protein
VWRLGTISLAGDGLVETPGSPGDGMVTSETTYVKLNIGAPMNRGAVGVNSIRDYIRIHGGYQVDPVASPKWVMMPDGSAKRTRDQEVAIYTFLVPTTERIKIVDHVKQEGFHVIDVLPG